MKFAIMRQLQRGTIGGAVRTRVRFGSNRCIWCHRQVRYRYHQKTSAPTDATREHIIPRSLGGGGGANLAVACRQCNSIRSSDTTWVAWRSVDGGIVGQAYRWRKGCLEGVYPSVVGDRRRGNG